MREQKSLIKKVLRDYRLDISGIHGLSHWIRVIEYGQMLGQQNGADLKLVTLFGLLHDSRRFNDRHDRNHGPRAATYIRQLQSQGWLNLTEDELSIICQACTGHTGGLGHENVTIATGWDADRLDLHRFGWEIDPELLNTQAAKDFVQAENPPFIEPAYDPDGELMWQAINLGGVDAFVEPFIRVSSGIENWPVNGVQLRPSRNSRISMQFKSLPSIA